MNMEDVPTDVIQQLCLFLEPGDLLHILLVSKQWHSIVSPLTNQFLWEEVVTPLIPPSYMAQMIDYVKFNCVNHTQEDRQLVKMYFAWKRQSLVYFASLLHNFDNEIARDMSPKQYLEMMNDKYKIPYLSTNDACSMNRGCSIKLRCFIRSVYFEDDQFIMQARVPAVSSDIDSGLLVLIVFSDEAFQDLLSLHRIEHKAVEEQVKYFSALYEVQQLHERRYQVWQNSEAYFDTMTPDFVEIEGRCSFVKDTLDTCDWEHIRSRIYSDPFFVVSASSIIHVESIERSLKYDLSGVTAHDQHRFYRAYDPGSTMPGLRLSAMNVVQYIRSSIVCVELILTGVVMQNKNFRYVYGSILHKQFEFMAITVYLGPLSENERLLHVPPVHNHQQDYPALYNPLKVPLRVGDKVRVVGRWENGSIICAFLELLEPAVPKVSGTIAKTAGSITCLSLSYYICKRAVWPYWLVITNRKAFKESLTNCLEAQAISEIIANMQELNSVNSLTKLQQSEAIIRSNPRFANSSAPFASLLISHFFGVYWRLAKGIIITTWGATTSVGLAKFGFDNLYLTTAECFTYVRQLLFWKIPERKEVVLQKCKIK